MKAFFAALQFLTVIPVPRSLAGDEGSLEKSVPCFPLVGLLIGLVVAAADWLLGMFLTATATTVISILLLTAITGGLHMDGLADTADGFGSARTRERMLEIMRDSRIGTMGVMAIVFVIALKIAALAPLAAPQRHEILILMPLAGRSAIILMMTVLPYARPAGGLAGIFIRKRSWWTPVWAWALLLAVGSVIAGVAALAAAVAAAVATGLMIRQTRKKIGGFTGDTLGAASEVVEAVVALTALAWLHGGLDR